SLVMLFLLLIQLPPSSTLFPYTTLFRSDEGEVVATLVRHHPPERDGLRPARAVLYVHGWSDYFFQRHLAQYWTSLGAAFYALDLDRKSTRLNSSHVKTSYAVFRLKKKTV